MSAILGCKNDFVVLSLQIINFLCTPNDNLRKKHMHCTATSDLTLKIVSTYFSTNKRSLGFSLSSGATLRFHIDVNGLIENSFSRKGCCKATEPDFFMAKKPNLVIVIGEDA